MLLPHWIAKPRRISSDFRASSSLIRGRSRNWTPLIEISGRWDKILSNYEKKYGMCSQRAWRKSTPRMRTRCANLTINLQHYWDQLRNMLLRLILGFAKAKTYWRRPAKASPRSTRVMLASWQG